MPERQKPELSHEEQIKYAYNAFARLVRKHGQKSSEGSKLFTNARTLSVSIPSDKNPHKHPDFISGRNYFPGFFEIFYRKGNESAQIALSKVNRKITIKRVVLLKPHYSRESVSYERDRSEQDNGEGAKPNLHVVIELLDKAGKILRGEEAPHPKETPLSEGLKGVRGEEAARLVRGLVARRDRLANEREEELKKKKRNRPRNNIRNLPINPDNELPPS